jgi:hypothetical protein
MTTNRTPISRRSAVPITPVALQAFKQLRVLEAACVGEPGGCIPHQRCASCDSWWHMQGIISRECHVRPWIWPACEPAEGRGEWTPAPEAVALWAAFEEAASASEPRPRKRGRAHVAAEVERQ